MVHVASTDQVTERNDHVDHAIVDRRYATPTGEPCPRSLRLDGTVEGSGDCHACGCCLLGSGLL